MNKLSKEYFHKAEKYILEKARPIEKALFKYHFENGKVEEVLLELSKFQNSDGGFGHSIESDARLEASSCLHTSVAFQILRDLNIGSENEMVKKAIQYLINNFNKDFNGWLTFPKEIDEVPRAAWWNYEANEGKAFTPNPSAELTGYILQYKELVPETILENAITAALKYLELNESNIEMHDFLCYKRLACALSGKEKELVTSVLRRRIHNIVDLKVENWSGYAAKPFMLIHSPKEELAAEFTDDIINLNLKYIIETQNEEGVWEPCWSWGRYPEEWETAKLEWTGVITLENLLILKAFNRIEE